jgi:ATP-dependent Clp protease ATP-binding subunit ClpA
VILFDEIEKAHPEVFNILLQILDRGRLTDAKGRLVNFKNTIIILTSNVGSEALQQMAEFGFTHSGKEKERKQEETKSRIMESLKNQFRPEFLNRLDEIIIFHGLGIEEVRKIVDLQLSIVEERLKSKKIKITVSTSARNLLSEKGFDPDYGVRPLKRKIQQLVLDPLAKMIVDGKIKNGDKIKIDAEKNEIKIKNV